MIPLSIQTLNIFSEATERWFSATLGEPTPVQAEAWPAIYSGKDVLVSAPTGTGKTLSAFLVFIDKLKQQANNGTLKRGLQLIYISPLKSLTSDIRENLNRPLNGIGGTPFMIDTAIRTGDTTAAERRKMIKSPPHILITTPESLYLMLTSESGQSVLKTASAIIIDELHAIINSKRGTHLMLSIARLDKLCGKPLQRIGLSATIEPLTTAAEYLSPEGAIIVAPKMKKQKRLEVISSFPESGILPEGTIWPELSQKVLDYCEGARSVIAFGDGRRCIEKLAFYVNRIAGDGFARTHHGSLSKEQRLNVEKALRDGELRLLCATSSMELGIDVGDIDVVLQIGCPFTIAGAMQRLGRSGHNPGRESVMYMFPRSASEGLYCGITAKIVREGGIEQTKPPLKCLDVLAQHLVSMASGDGYTLDDAADIFERAYPFRNMSRDELKNDIHSLLCMLAGDFEHENDIPVRPRVLYDRINGRVEGDAYSRILSLSNSGAIPDRGMFNLRHENGAKLGELDEEFVFERNLGDKFLFGSFAWKIKSITKDTVTVTETNTAGATTPFWKGDIPGRSLETGLAFGRTMRALQEAMNNGNADAELSKLGLDEMAAKSAKLYIEQQAQISGILPDDRTIIIEHFPDELGYRQMMVHAMFGKRVNAPLAALVGEMAKRLLGVDVNAYDDDDGFLLLSYCDKQLPTGLLTMLNTETARKSLEAVLPSTPLFNMAFRYNAFRALMLGISRGKRQPLWFQRLRSAEMLDSIAKHRNHPLIRETKRECLDDYWDLQGLEYVLNGIKSGEIQIREIFIDEPSPMSLPFRRKVEASFMYDYYTTTSGTRKSAENELSELEMLPPSPEQLQKVSERARNPENAAALHSLLMIEGDLVYGELDAPVEWLTALARQGRVEYIEPGLWIAAEQKELYAAALEQGDSAAREQIVRRLLRYRGGHTPEMVAERYFWTTEAALAVLMELCGRKELTFDGEMYYHAQLYDRARRETVKSRRNQIKTLPPERYASLMASRVRVAAPSAEQLRAALLALIGQANPPNVWEEIILPTRVTGFRPALLDTLLSQGEIFWRLDASQISFHLYEDIDWDNEPAVNLEQLNESERSVYEPLAKRGASFVSGLSGLLPGEELTNTLLSLAEKGLIHADSFTPIRYRDDQEKINSATARQRVNARVKILTSGRWEITRPLRELSVEAALEREFDRAVIVCRDTVTELPWATALEMLSLWEYTGRARRGYFIEGLPGAQFIRERDFASVMLALEQPRDDIVWLSATDPAQLWGKKLAHLSGRAFMRLPGTAVALKAGLPVVVFEQKGRILRVFDEAGLTEAVLAAVVCTFVSEYNQRRIFPTVKRITVKQYPEGAETVLKAAGFVSNMDCLVYHQQYV